jgi:hypothetical protein
MAKKTMTKGWIAAHFARKFELSKKTASAILDEGATLAVSETQKTGSFTLPGMATGSLLPQVYSKLSATRSWA